MFFFLLYDFEISYVNARMPENRHRHQHSGIRDSLYMLVSHLSELADFTCEINKTEANIPFYMYVNIFKKNQIIIEA